MTELLYNYIDSEFKYEVIFVIILCNNNLTADLIQLIFGTSHFEKLVTYLVEKDQLENMVVASLKAKRYNIVRIYGWVLHVWCNICRLPEAIQLVEMYYQDRDKFVGTEALKVRVLNESSVLNCFYGSVT